MKTNKHQVGFGTNKNNDKLIPVCLIYRWT